MRTLLLVALLVPAAASAGPRLGLRAGWAPALGDASDSTPMKDVVASQLPIQADAAWRFGDRLAVGAYFSYGFGRLGPAISNRCDADGADCSVKVLRTGVQGTWAFTQLSPRWAPWAGAGLGYQWVRSSVSRGAVSATQTVGGWELGNVQAGVDFDVAPRLAVGPYAGWSLGRFSNVDGNDIAEKAWHQWLTFGVRGTFDP